MARTLGLEPKPTVLETAMLPITPGPYMVGVAGFEPATSWSQTKRSTKLSHTPMEPDTRYVRVTEGYKSPVLLIKLIWHIKYHSILHLYIVLYL